MAYDSLSRRHVLRGLGASLTLPLLPSLMPKAHAAAPLPKFFVATWYPHGGISRENSYPLLGTSFTQATMFPAMGTEPAHLIRHGRLTALKRTHASTVAMRSQVLPDSDAGAARVSPLIGSFVPDAILEKMNVLLGVDYLWSGGHNRSFLGNTANIDGTVPTTRSRIGIQTIDAVIAQAAGFYSSAERLLLKAPSLTTGGGGAVRLSSTLNGATVRDNPYTARSLDQLYGSLFGGVSSQPGTVDPRASVVDRVRLEYQQLVGASSTTGRRISLEDKQRLTAYMDEVQAISDRMRALGSAACSVPPALSTADGRRILRGPDYEWGAGTPTDAMGQDLLQRQYLELMNMLLVKAFQCGTTRIAVVQYPPHHEKWNPNQFGDAPTSGATDSHQLLFHQHGRQERQQYLVEAQRFLFRYGFVDLAQRMNAVELVPGVSLLDQAVAYWSSECGPTTHWAYDVPTITVGGGGGFFKTGHFVDYRNTARNLSLYNTPGWFFGVPQNQVLANLCQAMGLTPAQYELSDANYTLKFPGRGGKVPGYGDPAPGYPPFNKAPFLQHQLEAMSDKLPIVT